MKSDDTLEEHSHDGGIDNQQLDRRGKGGKRCWV
jgi:hypothetical protein